MCEALFVPGGVDIEVLEEASRYLSQDDYRGTFEMYREHIQCIAYLAQRCTLTLILLNGVCMLRMYTYVWMYACMYACMMYLCMHACMYVRTYVCMYVFMYANE